MVETAVWEVVLAAGVTAVATGIGALPFLLVREISNWWLGVFNAAAGGLMLAASHSLMVEGSMLSDARTLVGVLVGLGLIVLANTMIWMVFAELIPDALEDASGPTVGIAVTLAFAALFAVQNFVLHV